MGNQGLFGLRIGMCLGAIAGMLLALAGCASAPGVRGYEADSFTDPRGDHALPYRLMLPAGYDPKRSYPLVLFLHGSGEVGNDNLKQLDLGMVWGKPEWQAMYPCFVVAPQCPANSSWTRGRRSSTQPGIAGGAPASELDNLAMAVDLVKSLQKRYPVDPQRIYVAGISMGGQATWTACERYHDYFAAAMVMCGFGDPSRAAGFAQMPIWVFHGRGDNRVPVQRDRDMVAALRAAGGNPKYTEYPAVGHNVNDFAFEESDLIPWMFAQRLGHPAVETPAGPRPKIIVQPGIDLAILDITCDKPTAQAGERVTYTAVVKNVGSEPTPAGTVVGVRFMVDDAIIGWSDYYMDSLKPGETVMLKMNSGPDKTGVWKTTAGEHMLAVLVDDVNRIPDVWRLNNFAAKTVRY